MAALAGARLAARAQTRDCFGNSGESSPRERSIPGIRVLPQHPVS
jgi:hypothetical protein